MQTLESERRTRRSVVTLTGALAVGGLTSLAGCIGGGGGGGSGGSGGSGDGDQRFDGWMSGVRNYDGVDDETGSDEVRVAVGASGNGDGFAFDPPAVRVSTGTTVIWEWTGKGSQHNVVAENGDFESSLAAEAGHTFRHAFSGSGTYRYVCTPHRSLDMKGVVVVE